MSNDRINYTPAQNISLVTQVNRICPLCAEELFYKKKGKSYKQYEIAHIYPLNPTDEETLLLTNETRLSDDVNDEDNVIPLCKGCHIKFDRPRTVEQYRELFQIKKRLIDRSQQESMWKRHSIEAQISDVIKAIYDNPTLENNSVIEFSPKKIDEKLNDTISRPTHRKIKNNVRDYYTHIRDCFAALDQSKANLSEIISLQVKTFYLQQVQDGFSQQTIFENIVAWLNAKTRPDTPDAAEIIASFFIQNCEIFE